MSNINIVNTATDLILPHGWFLEDDMEVLIAEGGERYNDATSNWCRVSHIDLENDQIVFVGVYEDGSSVFRTHDAKLPWFVKKSTIRKDNLWIIAHEAILGASSAIEKELRKIVETIPDQLPRLDSPMIAYRAARASVESVIPLFTQLINVTGEIVSNDTAETEQIDDKNYITQFVDRNYMMDPETEDVIAFGSQLKNGMIVLIEAPHERNSLDSIYKPSEYRDALVCNRWCTVTEVSVRGHEVHFVGIYEDGVKIKRTMMEKYAWLVKKDSIPEPQTPDELMNEWSDMIHGTLEETKAKIKQIDPDYFKEDEENEKKEGPWTRWAKTVPNAKSIKDLEL